MTVEIKKDGRVMINGFNIPSPGLFRLAVSLAQSNHWQQAYQEIEDHLQIHLGHKLHMTLDQIREMNAVLNNGQPQADFYIGEEATVCPPNGDSPFQVYVLATDGSEIHVVRRSEADELEDWDQATPHVYAHAIIVKGWGIK